MTIINVLNLISMIIYLKQKTDKTILSEARACQSVILTTKCIYIDIIAIYFTTILIFNKDLNICLIAAQWICVNNYMNLNAALIH